MNLRVFAENLLCNTCSQVPLSSTASIAKLGAPLLVFTNLDPRLYVFALQLAEETPGIEAFLLYVFVIGNISSRFSYDCPNRTFLSEERQSSFTMYFFGCIKKKLLRNDNDYKSFSDNDVILILKVIVKMIIQFKQYLYRMAASVLRKKLLSMQVLRPQVF